MSLVLVACHGAPPSSPPRSDIAEDTAGSVDSGEEDTQADIDGDGAFASADCNDTDATVYPGAAETPYDGVDQDCDGADLRDADADGFDMPFDCDDRDPTVSPGADEVAGTLRDEDCDGWVDLDAGTMEDISVAWTGTPGKVGEASLGRSGVVATGDLDGDGYRELVAATESFVWVLGGDRLWSDGQMLGVAGGVAINRLAWATTPEMESGSITALISGNLDGGTALDVAVIGHQSGWGGLSQDRVFVMPQESLTYVRTLDEAPTEIVLVEGRGIGMEAAQALWLDIDGDGIADLLLGDDRAAGNQGVVVHVDGQLLRSGGRISELDVQHFSTSAFPFAGIRIAGLPDLTNDGLPEVFVGAWQGRIIEGKSFVEENDLADITHATLPDASPSAIFGIHDLSDDGLDDVVVGFDSELTLDGDIFSGGIGLWFGLGRGGVFEANDADAWVVYRGGHVRSAAGPARMGDGNDVVVAAGEGGWMDAHLVSLGMIPVAGAMDISTNDNFISDYNTWGYAYPPLLVDLDMDGDDELVGAAPSAARDFGSDPDLACGVLSVFGNPR